MHTGDDVRELRPLFRLGRRSVDLEFSTGACVSIEIASLDDENTPHRHRPSHGLHLMLRGGRQRAAARRQRRHCSQASELSSAEDLIAKKPGDAIPPTRLEAVVGSRPRRALRPDEPLRDDDLA